MSGVLGWVGLHDPAASALGAMIASASRVDGSLFASRTGYGFAIAAGGLSRTGGVFHSHDLIGAVHGHPFWDGSERRTSDLAEVVQCLLEAFIERDVDALGALHGDYALALIDPE